jgi:hypothetical protein
MATLPQRLLLLLVVALIAVILMAGPAFLAANGSFATGATTVNPSAGAGVGTAASHIDDCNVC